MYLVVNLYILLLHYCIVLLKFLLIFAVKLCLIILVVNLYIVLVHLCTVLAKSVMNHAGEMFCPCQPPHFKNVCIWNTVWRRVILNYCILIENGWRVIYILLDIVYLKHSTEQNGHFIKKIKSEMKRNGQGQTIKDTESWLKSWCQLIQLIKYCPLIG